MNNEEEKNEIEINAEEEIKAEEELASIIMEEGSKSNDILVILVILLSIVIVILGILVIFNIPIGLKNENSTNNNGINMSTTVPVDVQKSKVTLKNIKKINDKITEIFEITSNSVTYDVNIEFKLEDGSKTDNQMASIVTEVGKEKIVLDYIDDNKEAIDQKFTVENLKKMFNSNNFGFVKGLDDKDYIYAHYTDMTNTRNDFIVLFDENMSPIKDGKFIIRYDEDIVTKVEGSINPSHADDFNVKDDDYQGLIHIKVDKNKIYDLKPVFDKKWNEKEQKYDNIGELEERECSIENNKVSCSVINKFKITEIANENS